MAKANDNFILDLQAFRTVNTKDNPSSMKEDELPVLLNFMPIGQSLYSMPGYSASLATTPNGTTIVRLFEVNLNNVLYLMAATDDGALYRFDATYTRVTVAAAATFTGTAAGGPKFAQWKNTTLLIIDPNGYWSYDGANLVKLTTKSAPSTGYTIAVFKGRVWIGGTGATARTITYSAPDDFTDFQTASAGGTVIDNYASLGQQVNALAPTQDYLCVVGDHGTHVIFGVQVLSDGTTLFNLAESAPGIGSIYPDSVQVYGNLVYLMNETGVYVVSGAGHEIISQYLDGYFPQIVTSSFSPVGFFANINNKNVYCLLVSITSPLDSTVQKWFMCFYESRWFFAFMGIVGGSSINFTFACKYVSATNTVNYASYGNNIVQLFTGQSAITKRIRTKSMDLGYFVKDKQVLRVGVYLASSLAFTTAFTATLSVYAKKSSVPATVTFSPQTSIWINGSGLTATWKNNSAQTASWFGPQGENLAMTRCDGRGKRFAIEYDESGANSYVLSGFAVEGQYGADW